MSGVIPILTYLQLSYLLTQLIYARTKSPQKGLLLFRKAWNMPVLFSICFYQIHINMTNDCVSITKTLMMGVKLMTERYKKNTYIKSKRPCQCKEMSQKELLYFRAEQCLRNCLTQTFILTCCRLVLVYCLLFSIMLTIRSVILNLYITRNSIIANTLFFLT